MLNYIIPTVKDNAHGQLDATVTVSATSFLLKTGEGANFPQPLSSTATSAGTATVLNCTGIQALGVAVGDIITNLSDSTPASDSWATAVVLAVSTNSVTTTPLKGGSDDTWQSGDVFVVKPFVINLSVRTGGVITGAVTAYEKILITGRSTDTLTTTAVSGYRGFDGTTIAEYAANDFVTLEIDQSAQDGVIAMLSRIFQDFPQIADVVALTGNQTVAGVKTFSSFPITPSSAPTTDYQVANKEYVDDTVAGVITPFPKTIWTSASPSTITGSSAFTITHNLGVTEATVDAGKYSILIHGTNSAGNGQSYSTIGDTPTLLASPAKHEWRAGTPTISQNIFWQANTAIFYPSQTVTNATIQIQQTFA